ncbi:MAG: hydroxyacid dehydrogenase [Alphaproteobacteria bacterium]|nr:hydroxyacid dehydrogenase [Alphaproteobacteria bacterium]
MMHVWFYEAFEEEAEALRALLPPGVEAGFCAETIQEARHDGPRAPVISTRTQSVLPDAWEGRFDAWLSRSTGYDHLVALRERWSAVPALGYLPKYCATSVAEQALLMVLALLRRLPAQTEQLHRFERDGLTGREARGRTLAVFGVGEIGSEVLRVAHGIGMTAIGVDIDPWRQGVPYVSPDEALARADAIVCAMDLRRDNIGYFGAARLAKARPGAVFVNISRGEISPTPALLAALEAGRLGGVALDVYDEERDLAHALRSGAPPQTPSAAAALALLRRNDALLTPHNAFNTEEAVHRKSADSVTQVKAWIERGAFVWNAP